MTILVRTTDTKPTAGPCDHVGFYVGDGKLRCSGCGLTGDTTLARQRVALASLRSEVERSRLAMKRALRWFDKIYPRDVFSRDSTDPGPREVWAIRDAIEDALARKEGK